MKFNVCVLSDSIHAQCFSEVAESIAWALEQLGHEVTREQTFISDGQNVLFGVRPGLPTVPVNSIIYNGEQVNKDGMWPQLVELYKQHTIWDYSAANAKRYADWGLADPKVVPPGYAAPLNGRIPSAEKTHDVVFFGSQSERRERVLRAIEAEGFTVLRVPFGVYGAERDALIASARLCVNIHYYESAIFESVRCSYLAQNGFPVITESSVAGENTRWGISGISYNSLAGFVGSALRGDVELYGKSLAETTRRVSIVDDVRLALGPDRSTEDWAKKLGADLAAAGEAEYGPGYQQANSGSTAQHVTLCMIVKNEADVIERCLASVKPFLSRWCIVDTGSTDGTQDIIRKFMSDLPGQLHERPWKEFDGSRNDAIDLARAECGDRGWLMTLDADEHLRVTGDLEIPDTHDCYHAWVTRCEGCAQWARPMFMRASKPWFYEMPRHEGLYCRTHAPVLQPPLPNVLLLSSYEGARAKVGAAERFLADAQVLEAWLPQHPGHTRCQFYIAQSYHCAATATNPPDRTLMQKACMHYLKRAEMAGGYPEETFSSRLQAAQCMVDLGYPWERVQHTLLQAYASRPSRVEPLYSLAKHYRLQGDAERAAGRSSAGQYAIAAIFARPAATVGPPSDIRPEFDPTVNDWRAKDELATSLTYLNGHAEARDLFRHILRNPELPLSDRTRIEINLEMCLRVAPDPA